MAISDAYGETLALTDDTSDKVKRAAAWGREIVCERFRKSPPDDFFEALIQLSKLQWKAQDPHLEATLTTAKLLIGVEQEPSKQVSRWVRLLKVQKLCGTKDLSECTERVHSLILQSKNQIEFSDWYRFVRFRLDSDRTKAHELFLEWVKKSHREKKVGENRLKFLLQLAKVEKLFAMPDFKKNLEETRTEIDQLSDEKKYNYLLTLIELEDETKTHSSLNQIFHIVKAIKESKVRGERICSALPLFFRFHHPKREVLLGQLKLITQEKDLPVLFQLYFLQELLKFESTATPAAAKQTLFRFKRCLASNYQELNKGPATQAILLNHLTQMIEWEAHFSSSAAARTAASCYPAAFYDAFLPIIVKKELSQCPQKALDTASKIPNIVHLLVALKSIFKFHCAKK